MNRDDNSNFDYEDEDDTHDLHHPTDDTYNDYGDSDDYHMDSSSHEEEDDDDNVEEEEDLDHDDEIHGFSNTQNGGAFNPNSFFQQFAENAGSSERGRNLEQMLPGLFSMINGGRAPNGMMSSMNSRDSRISKLVDNVIKANEDPYIAMESLKELSENMLMMNQLVVDRAIPTEKLITALVDVLSSPFLAAEMELQMQACRCLYNLFEVNPESISLAVEKNIIKVLKEKLTEINFIDLAEQVLETLEYISRVHGKDILKAGDLTCYIQYYDFFTIHAQRKAIAIVANACARVNISDFDTIKDAMVVIAPIFQNVSDKNILSRLLNALYGIVRGVRETDMLEQICTTNILERLLLLTSSSDVSLDDKLNCYDIITSIVANSRVLSRNIIENSNISEVILHCLNSYSKNSNAALHETLMFVPNDILVRIGRFIALLLPPEEDQKISMEQSIYDSSLGTDSTLKSLVDNLTPIFVDIYMNSMDFPVRKYILIALLRLLSCLPKDTLYDKKINTEVMRLIGSALAQNKTHITDDKKIPNDIGVLIVGVLQVIALLIKKSKEDAISLLKREGISELIESFLSVFDSIDKDSSLVFEEIDNNNDDDEDDESSDYDSELEDEEGSYFKVLGSDFDFPDCVKPKKMKFTVFKPKSSDVLVQEVIDECKFILNILNKELSTGSSELKEIRHIVEKLEQMEVDSTKYKELLQYWTVVRDCVFRPDFTLSPFEFISSGLSSAISSKVETFASTTNNNKRVLIEVFGEKLIDFIDILQAALTRIETFEIIDCGLQGSEGGMASLGKQITIELIPTSISEEDKFTKSLKPTMISIQCISSFKTCCEFLKSRLLNVSFVESMLANETGGINSEEIKAIKALNDSDFTFKIGEDPISVNETIFGAVFKYTEKSQEDVKELWTKPHSIKFTVNLKKLDRFEELPDAENSSNSIEENISDIEHDNDAPTDAPLEDTIIENVYELEKRTEKNLTPVDHILYILKFLRANMDNSDIFINSKLSAKLSKQLDEPLIIASGALPDWTLYLTRDFSFLFPFESRMFFLKCVSFGYGRLIQLWKNKAELGKDLSSDNPILQLGRITRHKLRIPRDKIFLTGLKILDKYGSNPSILEMEYQDEVGTGLGPTLEFYATMSKDFSRQSLGMWRVDNYNSKIDESDGDTNQEYVTQLLFPMSIDPLVEKRGKIKELFFYLGEFIARSMLDNRILDFNFNTLFFSLTHELVRNQKLPDYMANVEQSIDMISYIDKQIGNSLKYMYENKANAGKIEELYLTFIVPGTTIPLIDNGDETSVTSENILEYINLLISGLIGDGIKQQLLAFIDGFSKVFPYSNLLILSPEELIDIFGRVEEDWSKETLYSCIVSDHGYTMDSTIIHDLISIMSSFNPKDKRLFTQFLTGSPRLPFGGFKALKPKFTVVLKHAEDGLSPDQYLPSVMTCANYLKLPKYSNQEIMRTRIQQAIEEGAGAFLLS
ncbi:similar to Saccharomyces cerevisiae YKL010C UFD4 Ubiquitin-protein ligase (E3) that interacts with Rpt4p and Rpt6p, two subunits of the 19S particle of the 26S proteasome [Maudiozyma saulgeensis]|uniref:HECT-type E3 ubiquitin transferase n=1 Tax=Maudiozyma saulgeensis TaxID=1789683 RepID=A0A1X7QZN0_9SACH|nr:similar to Saccharomyces cerevisiae YKL010C UFD4 Ubiquitin-protein ligase (E3) that interacts with Rpt4p and Rpt6p, two subunits of the 19S particle of the 26S proteasome [Kazachstania saulgeensis]